MSNHVYSTSKWSDMDVFNQMGNIGSEVSRALTAKRQGKHKRSQSAFYRGLDLIDETARLWATQKRPGLKELLYAREQFALSVTTNKIDPTLETYFMQFAFAARLNK